MTVAKERLRSTSQQHSASPQIAFKKFVCSGPYSTNTCTWAMRPPVREAFVRGTCVVYLQIKLRVQPQSDPTEQQCDIATRMGGRQ